MDDVICYYCGDWYECRDHVVPVSHEFPVRRAYGRKVPCCNLCNGMKSDNLFSSEQDIATFLIAKYQSKFRKLLRLPHWDREEIEELDHTLRSMIESKVTAKSILKAKLANLVCVENGGAPVRIRHYEDDSWLGKHLP